VFNPEKIEEWLKEVHERPSSAPLIIQFIINRLQELDEWNEKLREENLGLRSGNRVDEYERKINHLEYQLELLKRQIGGELDLEELSAAEVKTDPELSNLLVYGPNGRVLRLDMDTSNPEEGVSICQINNFQDLGGEPPRLLLTSSKEELMLIFTSGRIFTLPVSNIPPGEQPSSSFEWNNTFIPEEPGIGERLTCVVPISKMALSDFYLQISRRGYTKKIRKALAPTIMENKFIGTGVKVPADQTLTLYLGREDERYALVSYEGYLQYLSADLLPYTIAEAMRLGKTDHLAAACPVEEDMSIVIMTQIGKVIHRTTESLTTAADLQRKGRMLYSTARRESGVRVIGAGVVERSHWGLALHKSGNITLHSVSELIGKGSIPVDRELLDFVTFPAPETA